MLNKKDKKYIEAVLSNDETSTNEELVELFMKELHIDKMQANWLVDKRDYYLKNI